MSMYCITPLSPLPPGSSRPLSEKATPRLLSLQEPLGDGPGSGEAGEGYVSSVYYVSLLLKPSLALNPHPIYIQWVNTLHQSPSPPPPPPPKGTSSQPSAVRLPAILDLDSWPNPEVNIASDASLTDQDGRKDKLCMWKFQLFSNSRP